jgi:molybdopterin synthase catalytic subunit
VSEPKGAALPGLRSDEGATREGNASRRPEASEQASRAPGGERGEISLIAIRDTELSVDEVRAAVSGPRAGGIALFVGAVRDSDHGQGVTGLSYTAHPSAEAELRRVAETIAEKFNVLGVAAVHRVGDLAVGDLAVVTAVACAHRAEAFDACRELIDMLKATVPIWKHQRFTDGTAEWVGTP